MWAPAPHLPSTVLPPPLALLPTRSQCPARRLPALCGAPGLPAGAVGSISLGIKGRRLLVLLPGLLPGLARGLPCLLPAEGLPAPGRYLRGVVPSGVTGMGPTRAWDCGSPERRKVGGGWRVEVWSILAGAGEGASLQKVTFFEG